MHTILIQGPDGGPFVEWHPPSLSVWTGDRVRWQNNDHLLMEHSAASTDGGPEAFDTGAIPAGGVSGPITFHKPGVYTYRCRAHASTSPVARIEVRTRPTP